jgi:predicted RNA-binding protein YlqC (UPF0109 family)
MKEFIEFVVKHLVDNPEEVRVTQVESERTLIFELRVAKPDLGKVIGKKGRTARAIRTLLTAAAAKEGDKRTMLEIVD